MLSNIIHFESLNVLYEITTCTHKMPIFFVTVFSLFNSVNHRYNFKCKLFFQKITFAFSSLFIQRKTKAADVLSINPKMV